MSVLPENVECKYELMAMTSHEPLPIYVNTEKLLVLSAGRRLSNAASYIVTYQVGKIYYLRKHLP
jgi:hypothetical protein